MSQFVKHTWQRPELSHEASIDDGLTAPLPTTGRTGSDYYDDSLYATRALPHITSVPPVPTRNWQAASDQLDSMPVSHFLDKADAYDVYRDHNTPSQRTDVLDLGRTAVQPAVHFDDNLR